MQKNELQTEKMFTVTKEPEKIEKNAENPNNYASLEINKIKVNLENKFEKIVKSDDNHENPRKLAREPPNQSQSKTQKKPKQETKKQLKEEIKKQPKIIQTPCENKNDMIPQDDSKEKARTFYEDFKIINCPICSCTIYVGGRWSLGRHMISHHPRVGKICVLW